MLLSIQFPFSNQNIDIDIILTEMAGSLGKRKGDLKRSYNSIEKKKIEEGINEFVPEENFKRLILIGVASKYKVKTDQLDEIINGITEDEPQDEVELEELQDELDDFEVDIDDLEEDVDLIEFEEDEDGDDEITFDEDDEVEEAGSWEDIFASTPEPKEGGSNFERLPSLTIISGTTYYLKLVDPKELPYSHSGTGKDGKPYTSKAMDVLLVKVTPKTRYKERYEEGDERGNKCFVDGAKYKLWMSATAFSWFAKFWREDVGRKSPDGRIWTFEQIKKAKVTKYYFGEVNGK